MPSKEGNHKKIYLWQCRNVSGKELWNKKVNGVPECNKNVWETKIVSVR